MTHGDDIAAAGEDMRLAELDLVVDKLRGAQRDEDRVAIDFELGALMREQRVLDRQVVQREPLLHGAQQLLVRLVQSDPGETAVGLARAGFLQVELGTAPAGFIGDAVDDRAHRRPPRS